MTEKVTNNNQGLIFFQKLFWLGCLIYFAITSVLLVLHLEIANKLSSWGIILVLAATIGQLFVIAADFRRAGKRRFIIFSYILMTVIVAAAALSAFLL